MSIGKKTGQNGVLVTPNLNNLLSKKEWSVNKRTLIIAILGAVLMSGPAIAGPASDALGTCMIDFLNGKERKELGKWIFFAMSAHPEISQFSNVSSELRNESDEYIGSLVTRLLVKDCLAEAKIALKTAPLLSLLLNQ